jgi:hypothetical protein
MFIWDVIKDDCANYDIEAVGNKYPQDYRGSSSNQNYFISFSEQKGYILKKSCKALTRECGQTYINPIHLSWGFCNNKPHKDSLVLYQTIKNVCEKNGCFLDCVGTATEPGIPNNEKCLLLRFPLHVPQILKNTYDDIVSDAIILKNCFNAKILTYKTEICPNSPYLYGMRLCVRKTKNNSKAKCYYLEGPFFMLHGWYYAFQSTQIVTACALFKLKSSNNPKYIIKRGLICDTRLLDFANENIDMDNLSFVANNNDPNFAF